MQQVFSMCSMLLQRNTDTRKRKLNIRRYKVSHVALLNSKRIINPDWVVLLHISFDLCVIDFLIPSFSSSKRNLTRTPSFWLTRASSQVVPFSQRSGVLEWCSGTVPIGEFLVDSNKGAHKRFRPQDWTSPSCRKKMMVLLGHIQHRVMLGGKIQHRLELHVKTALFIPKSPSCCSPVTTGGSEPSVRREAPGLQRGVQELQARLQVFLHGAIPGPRGVDGETAGLHSQRGHLLYRYRQYWMFTPGLVL